MNGTRSVVCRIGSLEKSLFHPFSFVVVVCRIGSLEKMASAINGISTVVCRIGSLETDKLMKGYVSVTNYERLKEAAKWSKLGVFSAVIFDEAHYLKSPESKRHYWAKVCAGYMQKRFLLTGTPMVSGLVILLPFWIFSAFSPFSADTKNSIRGIAILSGLAMAGTTPARPIKGSCIIS